jgi:hypothetical protein
MPRSKHRRKGVTRTHTKPPSRGYGGWDVGAKAYYDPGNQPRPRNVVKDLVRAARPRRSQRGG